MCPKSSATPVCTHQGYRVHPGIQHVTGHFEVRLSELVLLGPPEGSVAHALLDDGMEPSQKEVQASSLVGGLKTNNYWVELSSKAVNFKTGLPRS